MTGDALGPGDVVDGEGNQQGAGGGAADDGARCGDLNDRCHRFVVAGQHVHGCGEESGLVLRRGGGGEAYHGVAPGTSLSR